jgi:hypothetical protein
MGREERGHSHQRGLGRGPGAGGAAQATAGRATSAAAREGVVGVEGDTRGGRERYGLGCDMWGETKKRLGEQ